MFNVTIKGAISVGVGVLATYGSHRYGEVDPALSAVFGFATGCVALAAAPEIPKYIKTLREWSHM